MYLNHLFCIVLPIMGTSSVYKEYLYINAQNSKENQQLPWKASLGTSSVPIIGLL